MRIVDRLIITLAALLTLVLGGTTLALVAGWNGIPWLLDVMAAARGVYRVEAILAGILAVAVALYLLVVAWQRQPQPEVVRQAGPLGEVVVSLRAMEALVTQAAAGVRGVRDVDARLSHQGEGLVVDLRLGVTAERPVPELSAEVQQRVAERIKETLGFEAARVGVQIRHIDAERRAHIE